MEPTVQKVPGLQLVDPAPMPADVQMPLTWPTAMQLKSWTLLEAAADAFNETNEAITDYLNRFGEWQKEYTEGLIYGPGGLKGDPNAIPPAPPKVRQAMLNQFGTAWDLVESDTDACKVPAYTKIPAPQSSIPGGGAQALQTLQNELGGAAAPSVFTNATKVTGQQVAPDGSIWIRIA